MHTNPVGCVCVWGWEVLLYVLVLLCYDVLLCDIVLLLCYLVC